MSERYRLEFLVKANSWDDVVKIFKSELDISTNKQNASDRDMNGTFLVHVYLRDENIDKKFYQNVTRSRLIALSYDPKGKKIRDEILNHVSVVEHCLRRLLLNISDVVEDYFRYFDSTLAKDFAKNGELIKKDDANPITSYLTLDDAIRIFSLDLSSWDNRTLTANDLMTLISDSENFDTLKNTLEKKIAKKTIWSQVDKYILKKGTEWEDIREDLERLKKIRNKAAHFRIVTESDLIEARKLARSIVKRIKKDIPISAIDILGLQKLIRSQFTPAIGLSKLISDQLQPAASLQKAIAESMMPTTALQDIYKNFGIQPSSDEKDRKA